MAHSAERGRGHRAITGFAAAGAVLIAVALAGCTSTRQEAQRLQLDAARLRAAIAGTHVDAQNTRVRPSAIRTITQDGSTAFVVRVLNDSRKAVTDLPISVGYVSGGSRVYLNDGTDLQYYQAHLPLIAAGKRLIWVYTATKAMPPGARPFVLIGAKPSVPALFTERDVHIRVDYGYAAGSHSVTVHLDNPTSVPQYQLQLYAYALQNGKYVAAGNITVADLGAGSKQKATLSLVGSADTASLRVAALPTILQ